MNDYQYINENGSPRDYYEIVNENGELCKEIERLNNIISGIEQYIKYYVMNNFKFDNNTADIILYQLEKLKDGNKEVKGYLEQEGTPTSDKPVEIKTKLIGKNLFETYEINCRQYIDNIPKDTLICISKKEFIEYKQQKEEIERLNSIINKLEKYIRSNEWGIDYEHSNCRTHLLDILEGSDK